MPPVQKTIAVASPRRVRLPADETPPTVYTGRTIERSFYYPCGDGLVEYTHMFKDTAEGWHDFLCQQAHAFDQEEPVHPLAADYDTVDVWVVRFRVEGEGESFLWMTATTRSRAEAALEARQAILESVTEDFPHHQIVITDMEADHDHADQRE